MSGILSRLSSLGLGKLENRKIYEDEKKAVKEAAQDEKTEVEVSERDLLYEKTLECPVSYEKFKTKIMKTGKAKLLGKDFDLRPRYEEIDAVKYDVFLCPHCGYAALPRYFDGITSGRAKLVKENISGTFQLKHKYDGETYSYEEALEMYTLCLANAVVKKAHNSEKAYICLKTAWILRGYQEELAGDAGENNVGKIEELRQEEEVFLQNALEGFVDARAGENLPICGMDEYTLDYLLAQLSFHFGKYDDAAKLVMAIMQASSAPAYLKKKVYFLKEQIQAALRETNAGQKKAES